MRSVPASARPRDEERRKKYSKTNIHPNTFPIARPARNKKRCAWNTASSRLGTLETSENRISDLVCLRRARRKAPKKQVRSKKRIYNNEGISEQYVEDKIKLPAGIRNAENSIEKSHHDSPRE